MAQIAETAGIQTERSPTLIASVQRALRLLEAVGEHLHGATAKQQARAAGLPLGTTYHLLRTLTHEGYPRRAEGRFFFGASVDGITRADSRQAEQADLRGRMEQKWADFRAAGHAHAVGLCLLSQLGEAERRDHLDRHRPTALTPDTVVDTAQLLGRLAAVRPTMPVLVGAMSASFVV